MNILIFVTNYLDMKQISSKRWRCLSRELVRLGNHVDVVACDDHYTYEGGQDLQIIEGVGYYRIGQNPPPKSTGASKTIQYELKHRFNAARFLYYLFRTKKIESNTHHKCRNLINRNVLRCKKYDYVICSIQNVEAFYMAETALKMGCANRLICDIRDVLSGLIYGRPEQDIIGSLQIRKITKKSHFIFAVNGGIKRWVLENNKWYSPDRIHVFPHGIDLNEDIYSGEVQEKKIFSVVYTGSTYAGLRKTDPLFSALRSFRDGEIELAVAGRNTGEFREKAEEYGIQGKFADKGMLSKNDALKLQKEADVLFYMTYIEDDSEYCGMSGKFPEYLASGKPILSLINAKEGYSWYKEETERYQFGVVIDANAGDADLEIYNYLRDRVDSTEEAHTPCSINMRAGDYMITTIAKRIDSLLKSEMESKQNKD